MSAAKTICPICGDEMNHHANKIDYADDDSASVDPVFDGDVKEMYTCPHCGHTELLQQR